MFFLAINCRFIKKTLSRVPLCSLPTRSMPKPGHSLVLGGHSVDPPDPFPQADGHLYPWLLTGSSRDRPIAASAHAVRGFSQSKGMTVGVCWIGILLGHVVQGEHLGKLGSNGWTPRDGREGRLATIQHLKTKENKK